VLGRSHVVQQVFERRSRADKVTLERVRLSSSGSFEIRIQSNAQLAAALDVVHISSGHQEKHARQITWILHLVSRIFFANQDEPFILFRVASAEKVEPVPALVFE
jgi:hypothetical protein